MSLGLGLLYMVLRGQIRDHDAILEAMRALARATLAVSAVVIGITMTSLGNPVAPVNYGCQTGVARVRTRSLRAVVCHRQDVRWLVFGVPIPPCAPAACAPAVKCL